MALDLEFADLELVDLELAGEERRSRPDEASAVKPQPHAILVGDTQIIERCVRRQGALEPADPHLRRGRRQSLRDEACEIALISLVGVWPKRECSARQASQEGEESEENGGAGRSHQKACPILR